MPIEDILKIQPSNLNHIISVEGYPINQLYGDNLNVLCTLLNNENVAGKVNLVYIDPPYATKTDNYVWNQPFDAWTEDSIKKEYQYVEEETRRLSKVK